MRPTILSVVFVAVACTPFKASEPSKRVALRRTGAMTFELSPAVDQAPYCLAYTVAKTGLTRLLTMSRKNESFECPPGRPIGGRSFRVPLEDGPVKVYTLFTDRPVSAASVSQQLLEQSDRQHLSVMDMRLPGMAALEMLEFVPEREPAPTVGVVVAADGGEEEPAPEADAGVQPQ